MKKFKHIFLAISIFFLATTAAFSQHIKHEIDVFKKLDSIAYPAAGQVLLLGSSSFTAWDDYQDFFPNHKVLNRAFGGSQLIDQLYWKEELIKYDPSHIVLYCGENDIAYDSTVSTNEVLKRFKEYYKYIRKKYPLVPFVYVSIKPSPSRALMLPRFAAANKRIEKYLKKKANTSYVDVYNAMLDENGNVFNDIWKPDSLHMIGKGYEIWAPLIISKLKK